MLLCAVYIVPFIVAAIIERPPFSIGGQILVLLDAIVGAEKFDQLIRQLPTEGPECVARSAPPTILVGLARIARPVVGVFAVVVLMAARHVQMFMQCRPIIVGQMRGICSALWFWFAAPVFMLRMAILSKREVSALEKLPFNGYELWSGIIALIAFHYARAGRPISAACIAVWMGISVMYGLVYDLRIEKGAIRLFLIPRHKLHISDLVEAWMELSLCFAVLYYAASMRDPSSFTSALSILDSIYFSVVTIATVGYGDIYPVSAWAKTLVIAEIFVGVIYVLFIVTVYLGTMVTRLGTPVDDPHPRADDRVSGSNGTVTEVGTSPRNNNQGSAPNRDSHPLLREATNDRP